MRFSCSVAGWVGLTLAAATTALAASPEVLFPEPLHIVRQIQDPIAGVTFTVDEYCHGDRIVTVSGGVTVVVDHRLGEITEIDRNHGTFSITSFAEVARASSAERDQSAANLAADARFLGRKQSADGRQLEAFEFSSNEGAQQIVITVGVDRKIALPLPAVEALMGATFPNRRSMVHDAILRAVAPSEKRHEKSGAAVDVALPSEHSVAYEVAGERIVFNSTAVSVDRQRVLDDLVIIPPGSRRVETRLTAIPRAIKELDHPPRPDPR